MNEKFRRKNIWWIVKSSDYFERSAGQMKNPSVIFDEIAKIPYMNEKVQLKECLVNTKVLSCFRKIPLRNEKSSDHHA